MVDLAVVKEIYAPEWGPGHRVSKICPTCENSFTVYRSLDDQKYCSRRCDPHYQKPRVKLVCENCGGQFEERPCRIRARFCKDACKIDFLAKTFSGSKSPHWTGGGVGYYGPNWKRQRRRARRRDGNKCIECGEPRKKRNLVVAHIVPFREFGLGRYLEANDLSNLMTLCRSCHLKFDWQNGVRA
jgi:hypothetical protein